jgi:hypothetical protein
VYPPTGLVCQNCNSSDLEVCWAEPEDSLGGRLKNVHVSLGAAGLESARDLLHLHDSLLFTLAYPKNRQELRQAQRELVRVAAAARNVSESTNARARRVLESSGIAWSSHSTAFSYDIAAWLALRHAQNAEIDGAGDGGFPLQSVLQLCLPAIEAEFLEAASSGINELLDEGKGEGETSRLSWLIEQLERVPLRRAREVLYEALQLYITVSPKDSPLSRTFARGLPLRPFYHERLLRTVDARELIAKPIPYPRPLSRDDRIALLDTARAVLTMMGRETDPISAATPDGVEYRELERGFAIALYSMPAERRFPLETHCGFVLFKNSVPVAYGGGWPFFEQCKIGINVFAPFRGGESAYSFCQVLRVYAQRFDVDHFVVEPYQFGAGNREGLLSGAFWFYYRLGFRPEGRPQAALAASEFERIGAHKGYRSPIELMRRLTRCDLGLRLSVCEPSTRWPDPALLSLAVTQWIGSRFKGDRAYAQAAALKRVRAALDVGEEARWSDGERHTFSVLSPLIAMIPDLDRWPRREKRGCVAIMRAKGADDEARYFRLLCRHARLRAAFASVLEHAGL